MHKYSIHRYGKMIADKVRMDAYDQALRQAVKPNSVVLDIGTGTGIFALLACQLGARHVYAIEPNATIRIAQEIAAANGYADRIEFIQSLSTQTELSERADVIISDLRGVLPFFEHHIPSIVDARKRLLAPGGTLIPQADTVWTAIVDAPELYNKCVTPWEDNTFGFSFEPARRVLVNSAVTERVKPEQLLVQPQIWAALDYHTVEDPNIGGTVSWTIERTGTAHGLIAWFDATLAAGMHFSNAPGAPELIYGQAFFPWSEPVTITAGDTVFVALHANLIGAEYVWRWETRVLDQGIPGQLKANFKQSTFVSQPLSPAQLHRRDAAYMPVLDEEGQIDRLILELMNGDISIRQIADQVLARFPTYFDNGLSPIERIRAISEIYSK